jgi:hypothetical protein
MASTALARAKEQISSLSKRASQLRSSSPVQAGMNAGIVVGSAAAAGALDAALPDLMGVKPSLGAGLILAGAGFAMKSPKMILSSAGMLAPHAYMAANDAAENAMAGSAATDDTEE